MSHLYKRGHVYYLKYYLGGRQKELSLRTTVHQIAREKQRQFDSGQAQGVDNPLPSRTPLPSVLDKYAGHIRAIKTAKSAQTEVYYLREVFGPICAGLTITSRDPSRQTRKRPPKSLTDGRRLLPVIEAACLEEITTAQIAAFVDFKVRDQGLKPKTANHYRSILRRLFNWAVETQGVRLPGNVNPASRVRPYKESAPEIRFLTLPQIDEQLHALRFKPQLEAMVAVLIYAGLRREELLWLTLDDIDLQRRHGGHGLIRVRAKTIQTDQGPRFWEPKTKRNRAVPISRDLRGYLDSYTPPATQEVDTGAAFGAGIFRGWFFPGPKGDWWDPDNFSTDLRDANRDAGLPWSSLDFRHTFGSHLAQRGVTLYKIATLMGNSPEICRRHYASLTPEVMSAEVEFEQLSIPIRD
ncbi:MAG: tyrosine-type recombinase/integrase [Planctomycetota bacterium]